MFSKSTFQKNGVHLLIIWGWKSQFKKIEILMLLNGYISTWSVKEFSGVVNPLMTGGNKKVTHTYTNLQLKAAES